MKVKKSCVECHRIVTLSLKEPITESKVKTLLRKWGWKEKRGYSGRPMQCGKCVLRNRKIQLAFRGPILSGFIGGSTLKPC